MSEHIEWDGYPDLKDVSLWVDETVQGGISLYLSAALTHSPSLAEAEKAGGFWMQLEGCGHVYFEFRAFIKGKAVFLARHMRCLPLSESFPARVPEREWRHFSAPLPIANEAAG